MHHSPRALTWTHADYDTTSFYHVQVFNAGHTLVVEFSAKPPQQADGTISRTFGADSVPVGTSLYFTVEAAAADGRRSHVVTSDPFTITEALDDPAALATSDAV